jgi:hypothetical protein
VAIALIALAGIALFVLFHLRPLSSREISRLAAKLRRLEVSQRFAFSRQEFSVDADFKRRMAGRGRLYQVDETLSAFPGLAAALLKYKKHEWVIVGFERHRRVRLMWLNKGANSEHVEFLIDVDDMVSVATASDCSTVLVLHNHPNPNPARYSYSRPSPLDLAGSKERAALLNARGLNLLEFVCERGVAHEYRRAISDQYLSVAQFAQSIAALNGSSMGVNLRLHLKRYFARRPTLPTALPTRKPARSGVAPASNTLQGSTQGVPSVPPANWYPDPIGAHHYRYWDGGAWSDMVADAGVVTSHPL